MAREAGETAVVVPIPAADPAVSGWRDRFDPASARGMPAHVTAVYPFVPERRLSEDIRNDLRALCFTLPPLTVRFRRTGRFPGVLYLAPEPADGLSTLTRLLAERWPEHPPYGGAYDTVVPHLTLAVDPDETVLDSVDAQVARVLPLTTTLTEAALYVSDGAHWKRRWAFPFGRIE
jgi:2'-5' RNA ligase